MMSSALTIELQKFLAWWAEGLALALPLHWRGAKRKIERYLLVVSTPTGAELELVEPPSTVGRRRLPLPDAKRDAGRVREWLDATPRLDSIPVVVRVPRDRALIKRVRYPAASDSELRNLISFDIERQTPFQRGEIYYDFVRRESPAAPTESVVDLIVVPKKDLDPLLQRVAALGLEVTAADCDTLTYGDANVNLLPSAAGGAPLRPSYGSRFALFILWMALIGFIPGKQVYEAGREIDRLETRERDALAAIRDINVLREEYNRLTARQAFFQRIEREHVSSLRLLSDLTQTLDDDTWLQSFDLKNGQVTLQGESGKASELPNILEASERFSAPRFSSPVTRNSASGLDRFQLQLTIEFGDTR